MSVSIASPANSLECAACGYHAATVSVAFCPGCGRSFVAVKRKSKRTRLGWLSVPPMLYPKSYKWFVFVSALDVVLTWLILLVGGSEVNVLADAVITSAGLKGVLIFKFCLVLLVVVICEVVGRRRPRAGQKLALLAIAVTSVPVVLSVLQIFRP